MNIVKLLSIKIIGINVFHMIVFLPELEIRYLLIVGCTELSDVGNTVCRRRATVHAPAHCATDITLPCLCRHMKLILGRGNEAHT